MIHLTGVCFFVHSTVNFANICLNGNWPRFNLSVIFCKKYLVILHWSPKQCSFLQGKFPMIYVRQCLDKLKVVPARLHVASHVCIRKRFTSEICLTKVWSKIIHGDNQPAPRPPTTSFSGKKFSGKTFFFSTSWKNWRFPIWLKNVNPKCYAVKYHGKTRACMHMQTGMCLNTRK